jgi:hypothetical protein
VGWQRVCFLTLTPTFSRQGKGSTHVDVTDFPTPTHHLPAQTVKVKPNQASAAMTRPSVNSAMKISPSAPTTNGRQP